jgi:hypothetical protein
MLPREAAGLVIMLRPQAICIHHSLMWETAPHLVHLSSQWLMPTRKETVGPRPYHSLDGAMCRDTVAKGRPMAARLLPQELVPALIGGLPVIVLDHRQRRLPRREEDKCQSLRGRRLSRSSRMGESCYWKSIASTRVCMIVNQACSDGLIYVVYMVSVGLKRRPEGRASPSGSVW